jgi:acetylornithine deacetylase
LNIPTSIRDQCQKFLLDLLAIPSLRGNEGPAARYVQQAMAELVQRSELVPVPDSIIQDPDYAFPLPGLSYTDTPNVECVIVGDHGQNADNTAGRKRIVFNTHLDVVPPSEGQNQAFSPYIKDGLIYARGACDAKGQVATLYALALLYKDRGIRPRNDLLFHFVIEEENGGNGALAMIRRGVEADAAIVLEPSELVVIPAVRGAVWFELKVFGRAMHSGSTLGRISALDKAFEAIQIFKDYHDRLLAESRGLPLFDTYADPMPLTIGQCNAGNWPASVPSEAMLRGLIGFLPNKNRHEVQEGLRMALCTYGDEWLREHFELTFPMLNNDGNMLPVDHPLVQSLLSAVENNGHPAIVRAMTAACDAWRYQNQAGIPTLVFGPGSLSVAHSKDEHISLDEVLTAAEILFDFCEGYQ